MPEVFGESLWDNRLEWKIVWSFNPGSANLPTYSAEFFQALPIRLKYIHIWYMKSMRISMQFHSVPCLVILPLHKCAELLASAILLQLILYSVSPQKFLKYKVILKGCPNSSLEVLREYPHPKIQMFAWNKSVDQTLLLHLILKKKTLTQNNHVSQMFLPFPKKTSTSQNTRQTPPPGTSSSFRPFFRRSKRSDSISAIRCCSS